MKKMSSIVTTERPLIPPAQTAAGASSSQATRLVTQVFSSHPLTGISSGQVSGPVTHPAIVNQPSDVPGVISVVQSTSQATTFQDFTGAIDRPDPQFTGPVSQTITSKKTLPPLSIQYFSLSGSVL